MRQQNIINDVVELGHTALELGTTEEFKGEVLGRLEQTFRSPTSVFLDWEHAGRENQSWKEEDLHFPHWDDSFRQLYYHNLRYVDPVFNWLDSGRFIEHQSVTRLTNLVRLADFNKSPLYTEMMRPLKCQYILTLALNCGPNLMGNVSLLRPSRSKDFDPAELHAARMLAPMLSGAYKILSLREELGEKGDLVNLVAQMQSEEALLILSEALEPVFYSEPMKELANELFNSGIDGIRDILLSSPEIAKYFRRFSGDSEGNRRQLPARLCKTLTVNKTTAMGVSLHHTRLPNDSSYLKIFARRIDTIGQTSLHTPQNTLSMRELQIAQLMAEGHTAQQVGKILCISSWTVKNHLKKIYSKLQVKNRASLARAIDKTKT